jgi:predicted transcriptional regulator
MGTTSRRSRIEIITDILEILHEPTGLTRTMFRANLSYVQVLHYLSILEERGLIQKTPEGMAVLTEKGRRCEALFKTSKRLNQELEMIIHN